MKLLPLFFGTLLLLCSAEGWARRRRLKSTEEVVERSSDAIQKRLTQVIEDPKELIVNELENCVENVLACGFLLKCQCCNEPNFYSCAGKEEIKTCSMFPLSYQCSFKQFYR